MPRKKLPDNVWDEVMQLGLTDTEATEEFARRGIEVRRQAVTQRRIREGIPRVVKPRRVNPGTMPMPWRVHDRHRTREAATAVTTYLKIEAGQAVTKEQRAALTRVRAHLRRVKGVLTYDPDTYEGWFIVPPREGIDGPVFRDPTVP